MKIENSSWKKGFFTIAVGQSISLIGSSAVQFTLIWWLSSETASPLMLSLAAMFAFVPQIVLGPFVGVWVDRLKRKNVIICADMAMGLVAVAFAIYFVLDTPPYWTACVVLGVRAIGGVFHTPAIQAAIPMLVPPEELVRANGWTQFMQSGAFMLGPVLGAAMYASLPMHIILLTDFLGAAVASITVWVVKIPELKKEAGHMPHFWNELKVGATVFAQDKKLVAITVASLVGMVFYAPLSTFYPLMTSSYFNATAWHASIVEIAFALGLMLSAIGFSFCGNIKRKFSVIHMGLFGVGITSLIGGMLPATMSAYWIFAISCGFMGVSSNLYSIPYIAYMQETISHEAQGRVFSLFNSLLSLTMPVGLLIAGPIAEKYGTHRWFFITGIAVIIITTLSAIHIAVRFKDK